LKGYTINPAPKINFGTSFEDLEVVATQISRYFHEVTMISNLLEHSVVILHCNLGSLVEQINVYFKKNKKKLKSKYSRLSFLKKMTGIKRDRATYSRYLSVYLLMKVFPAVSALFIHSPLSNSEFDASINCTKLAAISSKLRRYIKGLGGVHKEQIDKMNASLPWDLMCDLPRDILEALNLDSEDSHITSDVVSKEYNVAIEEPVGIPNKRAKAAFNIDQACSFVLTNFKLVRNNENINMENVLEIFNRGFCPGCNVPFKHSARTIGSPCSLESKSSFRLHAFIFSHFSKITESSLAGDLTANVTVTEKENEVQEDMDSNDEDVPDKTEGSFIGGAHTKERAVKRNNNNNNNIN
jgi:hypothetical protein